MNKKSISVIALTLILFLCSQFPVFAVTSGGKTITSNSYSYNDGDVTLYTRVNGHFSDTYYSGGDRPYVYEHVFTVTLTNNTNEFQVASTNNFSVDLYTGYTDTFASSTSNTPSGSTMYRPSWGSEVTSYSDNMTAPRVLMYPSGDNAGHVLITFSDSDLLVLNPNETRTYNFTINFLMTYDGINEYPINGNALYSYFTYYGSVSMYSRPSSFSANTIEDFISNDSLPNSVIAYFQYLLEQGEAEQTVLDNIYSYLQIHYPYQSSTLTNQIYRPNNNALNYDIMENNVAVGRIYSEVSQYSPYLVSSDHNIFNFDTTNVNYEEQSIICVPVRYHLRVRNLSQVTSYSLSQSYIEYRGKPSFNIDSGYYAGSDIQVMENDGLILQSITNTGFLFGFTDFYNAVPILYAQDYKYITIMEYRYFVVDRIYDTTNIVNIRHNVTDYAFPSSNVFYNTITATNNNVGWWKNNTNIFNSIKDKIQYIIDSYITNKPQADDVTDDATDVTSDIENQHQQEATYYSDTNTAIDSSGLDTYTFDSNTTSGLNGLKTDFTLVWNACGTLSNVWILSLTLSLALYIIRHRRMFKV